MLGLPGNRQASRSQLLTAASKTTITRFTVEPALDRQAVPGCQFSLGLASSHAAELALASCRETPSCRARLTAVANFGTYATSRSQLSGLSFPVR
jgi:hypothetical protein